MQFKTYTTPNGSQLLVDETNDLLFILNDLAPNQGSSIIVHNDTPSTMNLEDYTLVTEGADGLILNMLDNVRSQGSPIESALAKYILSYL